LERYLPGHIRVNVDERVTDTHNTLFSFFGHIYNSDILPCLWQLLFPVGRRDAHLELLCGYNDFFSNRLPSD